ncbi:MAG TPA: deoxyribonuclease IV [Methanotrichaceae archaeon]|nr:deoxyribonuclease IV [Methanotrichaceae archaeon]HQF16697.1 deoxyribonuclease IV [Methanotrichaceae archaeon]HQI91291.1 deoxyribonuclease IV [Methanotrichaceae archaeon]HQJ28705.1 deoxyribonuclease IV [Methanotrichaceae archaeon]
MNEAALGVQEGAWDLKLGFHVSIAGGIERSVGRAKAAGCQVFQIFTSNPRSWKSAEISPRSAEAFRDEMAVFGLELAVAHMPYLPNLASPRPDVHRQSLEVLVRELSRCQILGIPYLVTHMGSHLGAGRKAGLAQIIQALSSALDLPGRTMILLETTAGTRNSMGGTFRDIAEVMDRTGTDRLGVCLDTCHIFAAGYEVRTREGFFETMKQFDSEIGSGHIRLIHLNDCLSTLGSGRDRHQHLGLGGIGEDGLRAVLHHPALQDLPVILETPVDEGRDDRGNLDVARRLSSESC